MQNNTIPLIPSTSDLNAKLMDIVGQYNSIETSYLRVIASIHNENVELKETNAQLKKRIADLEEHSFSECNLKEANAELQKKIAELEEEHSQCNMKRSRTESSEQDAEDLKQKNVMLGKEIFAKNNKLQNQAKQLKEYKELIAKMSERK